MTTTTRRSAARRGGPYYSNWINLFVIVLVVTAVVLLWTTAVWTTLLRALVYTAIIMVAAFAIIRLIIKRTTKMIDGAFVLIGIGVGGAMMNPSYQDWFRDFIKIQITPLGLTSTTTGDIILTNAWLIILLLGGLIFGLALYRHAREEF